MALTALSGSTKVNNQKSTRQRSLSAKEDTLDTAVAVPAEALKSVELKIKGVQDEGAFGKNTIGQEIEGKVTLYATHSSIRTFAHELVTKTIEHVTLTTNGGHSYVFETADNTPALCFAYEDVSLVTPDDKPMTITLLISGYRDNLVVS